VADDERQRDTEGDERDRRVGERSSKTADRDQHVRVLQVRDDAATTDHRGRPKPPDDHRVAIVGRAHLTAVAREAALNRRHRLEAGDGWLHGIPQGGERGAARIGKQYFAVFPQPRSILKNRLDVAERESRSQRQPAVPRAHRVLAMPVHRRHRRQRSHRRRCHRLPPPAPHGNPSRAVPQFNRRCPFSDAQPHERHARAFAFQAERALRCALATQRFEAGEKGVEAFLAPLEEPHDGLLTRLGHSADREPRLIFETLPRCAIGEPGDHTRAEDIETDENQGKVVPDRQRHARTLTFTTAPTKASAAKLVCLCWGETRVYRVRSALSRFLEAVTLSPPGAPGRDQERSTICGLITREPTAASAGCKRSNTRSSS